MDSTSEAVARCDVVNEEGFFTLEFSVKFETTDDGYSYMARNNATSHASFWWGARLMNAYFIGTKYLMAYPVEEDSNLTFTRAGMNFWYKNTTTSMKDFELFRTKFFFLDSENGVQDSYNAVPKDGKLFNNPDFQLSRPLTEGFFFAKVFRSLMLADLGNTDAENILLDPELLQYALDPKDEDFNRVDGAPLLDTEQVDWFKFNAIPLPTDTSLLAGTAVQMNQSFARFENQTGPLKTEPASIYAEYICAVPEMKPMTAVIMFSIVSTLALFQTAWTVFKYVVDQRVMWKDERANWCEACLAKRQHELKVLGNEDSSSVRDRKPGYRDSDQLSDTRSLLRDSVTFP